MSDNAHFEIKWHDAGREPQCPSDPAFPDGRDIDASRAGETTCTVELKHPAKRCGYWYVRCTKCDQNIVISTAGRPDDPRSAKFRCKVGAN